MDGSWRPLCYGRQYMEGRRECDACPFRKICMLMTDDRRSDLAWKYREGGRDGGL